MPRLMHKLYKVQASKLIKICWIPVSFDTMVVCATDSHLDDVVCIERPGVRSSIKCY
jgi:hypothetical protein